jgi:hypothetical protein
MSRGSFAPEMMVKQYVAVVKGKFGARWRVFQTGDPKYYLFSSIAPDGTEGGLQFPVLKKDLKKEIKSALAHGWGNAQ